jgi:AraC family transcriptional regulator
MAAQDVELRTLPATRVAYMRHVGRYGSPRITDMWRRFASWCATRGLTSQPRRMFGIAQDNPNITPATHTRYDACIEVDDGFQPTGGGGGGGVGVQMIRGGTYACTPFFGNAGQIQAAWVEFLGKSLPDAGYQHDVAPALEIYEPGFAVDPKTGAFTCTLCMAVRTT